MFSPKLTYRLAHLSDIYKFILSAECQVKTITRVTINYYLAISFHEKTFRFFLKCGLFMAVFKEIPSHNNPIEFYRIFAEYFQWGIALEFQNGKIG